MASVAMDGLQKTSSRYLYTRLLLARAPRPQNPSLRSPTRLTAWPKVMTTCSLTIEAEENKSGPGPWPKRLRREFERGEQCLTWFGKTSKIKFKVTCSLFQLTASALPDGPDDSWKSHLVGSKFAWTTLISILSRKAFQGGFGVDRVGLLQRSPATRMIPSGITQHH
jgi:hypothetical protein